MKKYFSVFAELEDYRASPTKAQECLDAFDALTRAEERQRHEKEAAAAKKKQNTILGILAAVVVCVLVVTLAFDNRKSSQSAKKHIVQLMLSDYPEVCYKSILIHDNNHQAFFA